MIEELLFQHYICNITQEPQELEKYNSAWKFIGMSAVIKYHQLLSVKSYKSINRKLCFDK